MIEGALDVSEELAQRGIAYGCHVERPGHREPALVHLAREAALVVTEHMPTRYMVAWSAQARSSIVPPVWEVDCACIVPTPVVGRAYARAFDFRTATAMARDERISRVWSELDPLPTTAQRDLLFEPVNLNQDEGIEDRIDTWIASADIDHSVGPVGHTRGGSRAGYARWDAWRVRHLHTYAARRNDALDTQGVSRLSAYLRHGHVSPMRIAREAHLENSEGALKYLDELLVWREMSYAYCAHTPEHDHYGAVPEWARVTLEAHATNGNEARYTWEELARGRTSDALWNAAQCSLTIHGALHNNVRMTWGKQLLCWARSPAHALELLFDLNDRYALDGQDPNSVTGVLWCLGAFDRSFKPEEPIWGTVRSRSSAVHARRLDITAYGEQTAHPSFVDPPRVCVVGAGIAGATCARTLHDHGIPVEVVDKGQLAGGRMSARAWADGRLVDHGAPAFLASHPVFERYMRSWSARGLVSPWSPRVRDDREGVAWRDGTPAWWVGCPTQRDIVAHLMADVPLRSSVRVHQVRREGSSWIATDDSMDEVSRCDVLVLAIPSPQAMELMRDTPVATTALSMVTMQPSWTWVGVWDAPIGVDVDVVIGDDASPVAWLARESSKPGRPLDEAWVAHASPSWSRAHLERSREEVTRLLTHEVCAVLGGVPAPNDAQVHRWRFARPELALGALSLGDRSRGWVHCGDGVSGGGVEQAFLSGLSAAGRVLAMALRGHRKQRVHRAVRSHTQVPHGT